MSVFITLAFLIKRFIVIKSSMVDSEFRDLYRNVTIYGLRTKKRDQTDHMELWKVPRL